MGSFSGKMEVDTATDTVAKCCRQGPCCQHGSPLAIRGKRLSPKIKPTPDKRHLTTKDVDLAKNGEFTIIFNVYLFIFLLTYLLTYLF